MAPLGVALLMGVVIVGTVGVVVLGGAALTDTQDRSDQQRAEHVLTLFDSRAAMVALGDSDTQTTALSGDGTYTVVPDSGTITLVHTDYNQTNDEVIYNDTMGALVYEAGDTTVAYQGGGVWRQQGDGDARVVTPPEFYFRRSTLTFPLVRVGNSDSASGSPRAEIRAKERANPIYPNRTAAAAADGNPEVGAPYDPVSGYEEPYDNPLENGSLTVRITSDYYAGWAEYFRSRTEANVTTFDSNNTVKADLVSVGQRGNFPMPKEGNGLTVRGLEGDGHNLQNFSITLTDEDGTEADFSNLKWSLWDDQGRNLIELHVRHNGGAAPGDPVQVHVYYSENGGDTWQGWRNDAFTQIEEGDFDGDGDTEKRVRIDFTGQTSLDYTKNIQTNEFDAKTGDHEDTMTFDAHSGGVSWEGRDYDVDGNSGEDTETSYNVTAHYFAEMGEEFTLTVKDNPSGSGGSDSTVNEDASSGRIEYPGSAKFIAYLHATENEVEIDLE